MAKVRFKLRRYKDRDPLIQFVYRMDGAKNELVFGTKLHVPEKHWNKKERRARLLKGYPEYVRYNAILDRWEESFNKVWQRFQADGVTASKEQLKEALILEMTGKTKKRQRTYLLDYFDDFLKAKKESKVTMATIKQYQNAYNLLKDYISKKHRGAKKELKGLDKSFIVRFISFLANEKGHQDNTVNKTIKRLRSVLNEAYREGLIGSQFYLHKDCQVTYVKQPKIYLNEDEIQSIVKVDLSKSERLDRVRDKFLIGVWTGLRISDLSSLSLKEHVIQENGKSFIHKQNQKTKRFTKIPLKTNVLTILQKYEDKLPSISDQKFNLYLKELCRIAGTDSLVYRVEDGSQKTYEKWELVSSHICRRSFATNAYKAGIPPKYLMPITGHTTVKQFYEYICVDEDEAISIVSTNEFFD